MATPLPPLSEEARAIVAQVERFATRERLFRRTQTVLVALSGGADSVACLLLHLRLREQFGFAILAAHFDHQLRPESHADLEWARTLCERLDIPCLTGEGDVARAAREGRRGIEETARLMRYQFLGFIAGQKRADCVATGHTADDQAETVLLRIARGTGVRGLRGMLPASTLPGSAGQRLIRPLLQTTRDQTHRLCEEAGIAPLMDPTNAELVAARNIVRHRVLPALRDVNPGVRASLLALARHAREAFAETERRSHVAQPRERSPGATIFERGSLAGLESEALTLVLEREAAFLKTEVEVNRTRLANLRQVLTRGAGEVLFGDLAVGASCGLVRFGRRQPPDAIPVKVLNVPGISLAGPWRVEVSSSPLAATPGTLIAELLLEGVRGVLRARAPTPGDRILYHRIERKLADVFANAHVPRWDRRQALAVVAGDVVMAVLTPSSCFQRDGNRGGESLFLRASRV